MTAAQVAEKQYQEHRRKLRLYARQNAFVELSRLFTDLVINTPADRHINLGERDTASRVLLERYMAIMDLYDIERWER